MARGRRTDLDERDLPRGRRPIGRVFAFRADPAMVQALNAMPNASDFIRKAITRSLEEPCPVCIGTGVVATGFRSQLERLEGHLVLRRCSCCATEYPGFCADVTARLKGPDRLRWELEVKRGEFLCAPCLERAPPCDTCGRPMERHASESFVAHFRVQRVGRALLIDPVLVDDGDDSSRPGGRRRRAR
jgi:hypothetical protein